MPKIRYSSSTLRDKSLRIIEQANLIIADYQQQGLDLTLRQLYYQFVSRGLIPNKDAEYKKLGNILNEARMAGLVDWDAIVDRTRYLRSLSHWDSPQDIVNACVHSFRVDKWAEQENYVEVWIEKDALVGVIEGVCQENDIPYFACRGYASASEIWRAGRGRMRGKIKDGKECTVLYLGDHDPSGIDMVRDLQERLDTFTEASGAVRVKRIALNMDQIEEHNPPPNPTKMTDSRSTNAAGTGYADVYGDECWELDALDPVVIRDLIQGEIDQLRNETQWEESCETEKAGREQLKKVATNWKAVLKKLP